MEAKEGELFDVWELKGGGDGGIPKTLCIAKEKKKKRKKKMIDTKNDEVIELEETKFK